MIGYCNLLNMSKLNTGGIRLTDFMNFNINAFPMRVGKGVFCWLMVKR